MIHSFRLANILPVLIFFGLFGMGITLPVLELYGHNPEVFIANRSSSAQIVAFALIVAFLPAAVMGVIWRLGRAINLRAGEILEFLGISIAGFFVSASLLRYVMESTNLSLAIAIPVGIFLGLYGRRQGVVRNWLSYLIIVPLISLASFLVFSDSAGLLWQEDAEAVENANVANPISVVFLVLDELPLPSLLREDGQINDALFPNFARVAKSSYWFRNYATNSVKTADSIPILLSGVISEDSKPTSADHPKTLFTLLGQSHAMYVRESVTSLCPDSICTKDSGDNADTRELKRTDGSLSLLLTDALVVYGHLAMPPLVRNRMPAIGGRWGGFIDQPDVSSERDNHPSGVTLPPAPKTGRPAWINDFLAAKDRLATSVTPSLHYTHIMAPHIPWRVNPSLTVYSAPDYYTTIVAGLNNGYWPKSPEMPTQGLQRHLAQLGAVDKLLGYYIDELQRTGFWNEALVIVTADHGASFKPGTHRRDTMGGGIDALYRVPLFIHLPGQDFMAVRDEPAFSLDVLPTIIDVLEVAIDWSLPGLSLLGELPATRAHDYDHFTGKREALDMRLESLMKEVEHDFSLIPDTGSWKSIAAVGPYRELVGKNLVELGSVGNESIFVVFDLLKDDLMIDEQTGKVPTFFKGLVSVPPDYNTDDFLVAVNGIIAGAGTTLNRESDTFDFYGYVPESAFRMGRNTVELVFASEDGSWHHSIAASAASRTSGPRFSNPVLSPVFADSGDGTKSPPFKPANSAPTAYWQEKRLATDGQNLYLRPSQDEITFAARYVYIPIIAEEAQDVDVLIGSDDTLEVWFEGNKILEHLTPRAARLGDNQVRLQLKPGVNHLYFRIDNRGGAWRLITKITPYSSSASENSESGRPGFATAFLSPVFPFPDEGFKTPPFDPSDGVPPSGWQETILSTDGLLDLDLRPMPGATRYVYVPIKAEEAQDVEVLIGSDDILEVWFEGQKIAGHASRQLLLQLKPGTNHLYFRVDNHGGAWQLNAKMKTLRVHRE